MSAPTKCSEIPDAPILAFLTTIGKRWATWGKWAGDLPSVQTAMPAGTVEKLQVATMRRLIARGLVEGCGCGCGCRGDYRPPSGT